MAYVIDYNAHELLETDTYIHQKNSFAFNVVSKNLVSLISLIAVEVGINVEGGYFGKN